MDTRSLHPDTYHARLLAASAEAFAGHAITSRSEGRWVLHGRDADGRLRHAYWTEVVVLRGGTLLAHGDIDTVLFAHYGDSADPAATLRWMGACEDFRYYVRQKAAMGTGRELIDATDLGVCRWHLERHLATIGDDPDEAARYRAALGSLDSGSDVDGVRRELCDAGEDPEDASLLGRVIAPRLYFAHAALRRLCALLDVPIHAPTTEVHHG